MEKDVVLAIAGRVKAKLAGEPNLRVMLTRGADYFVPLATRVGKARSVRADLIGGVNLKTRNRETAQLLMELMTTSQIRDSRLLASAVLDELGDIGTLHKPRVEQAGFAVLKAPDIPSILVETAFISNPDEELKLRSPRHQDQVANAIVRGIKAYFRRNPPGPRGKFSA